MSFIRPGCDTKHIIQEVLNSRSLGTLGRGEGIGICEEIPNPEIYKSKGYKKPTTIVNKEDLLDFKSRCEGKTQDELFEILGIKTRIDRKGDKYISHYQWPYIAYSFKAAGIDEEKLLEGIKGIDGNCDLTGTSLKNLGSVTSILGTLTVPLFGEIEDLSSIEYIGRDIICDAESPKEAVNRIKELNLEPKHFHGYINPMDISELHGLCYMFNSPTSFDENLRLLQAERTYFGDI